MALRVHVFGADTGAHVGYISRVIGPRDVRLSTDRRHARVFYSGPHTSSLLTRLNTKFKGQLRFRLL